MTASGDRARQSGRKGRGRGESLWATASLCIVTSGLWILWSGHFSIEHPLLAVFGLLSMLLVLWLCGRMGIVDAETLPLHLTARTLRYVPWLGVQVILSSLDVLRRSITLDLSPTVVTVKGSQKTDLGLVSYANSITLTPGTTSLDSDADSNAIIVHAVSEEGAATLCAGGMDRWVYWVENGAWPEEDGPEENGPGRGEGPSAPSSTGEGDR